jgi:hypothetical protein
MIQPFRNCFIDILQQIYKERYNFDKELKYFHTILDTDLINEEQRISNRQLKRLGNDRNSLFYRDYHMFIDSNPVFNNVYEQFIETHVKPLYVNKDNIIVVQKTPNIRISFPNLTAIGKHEYENEKDNVIGLHKDSDFGHHEEEINFIIPITEMFESNSLYYEPDVKSGISTDNYINLLLHTDEFFIGKLNKLLHFNRINETNVTRISLDFRVIPYEKYMSNLEFFKNTKFELGKYYILK